MTYIRFPKGKEFSVKGKRFSVFQTDRTDPASIQAGFLSQRTKGESKSDSNFISTPTGWPYVMLLNCAQEQMLIGLAGMPHLEQPVPLKMLQVGILQM